MQLLLEPLGFASLQEGKVIFFFPPFFFFFFSFTEESVATFQVVYHIRHSGHQQLGILQQHSGSFFVLNLGSQELKHHIILRELSGCRTLQKDKGSRDKQSKLEEAVFLMGKY